jgi:hypothetical protein
MTDYTFANRLVDIATRIKLAENFDIVVARDLKIPDGRWYFQIKCWRKDVITKEMGWGYGGKAYLSEEASDSELVGTIFGLYKNYVEHEARESFEFDGYRIYGPHMDVNALKTVARKVDVRSAQHVEDMAH